MTDFGCWSANIDKSGHQQIYNGLCSLLVRADELGLAYRIFILLVIVLCLDSQAPLYLARNVDLQVHVGSSAPSLHDWAPDVTTCPPYLWVFVEHHLYLIQEHAVVQRNHPIPHVVYNSSAQHQQTPEHRS